MLVLAVHRRAARRATFQQDCSPCLKHKLPCRVICSYQISVLQDIIKEAAFIGGQTDASGNPVLADIGKYLAGEIKEHFDKSNEPVDLKYIDPAYMVRAIPTIPVDHVYCTILGQNAVHAAFAGYTGAFSSRQYLP